MMIGVLCSAIAIPLDSFGAAWRSPTVSAGSTLPRANPIELLVPGDRVLCLFDSSEGVTAERNPLTAQVAPAISSLGFEVLWHDVARGLPPIDARPRIRAVVSGYLDGAMDGAADYASFVRAVVSAGKRFVVVGSYGAYQEKSTGEYIEQRVLNTAFEALGVRYEADWTDDPERFDIRMRRDGLATAQPPDASTVRHFYRISPLREDVEVLVEAIRKDSERPGEPSAVVFTSATGAMALARYLSPAVMLDDPDRFHLELRGFLVLALAFRPSAPSTLLVLFDPESSDSRRAMTSLSVASSYTGIPMVGLASQHFNDLRPMDLATHTGIVLACPTVPSVTAGYVAGLLRSYSLRGGRLLAVLPIRDPVLASVIWNGPVQPEPITATGIRFHDGGFPGIKGLEITAQSVSFSGLKATPGPDCRVLAESMPCRRGDTVPLWWRCRTGKGSVSALNAFEFVDRAYQGFVVQSLLDTEGSWAMPVLSVAVEFVDDCPLPMTGRFLEPMGKEDTGFYSDDFFDMVADAVTRLGIRPVFLAVFSYDDRVRPPFEELYPGSVGSVSRSLARRIVSMDLPVGLHGRNHLSPVLSGGVSRPFPDGESIRQSFTEARSAFLEVFGPENLPVVYVPPNNNIDLAGKIALAQAIPEVRIIASVFSGSDVEMLQDFAMDPDVHGITSFPRTWAGYFLEGESVLGLLNGLFVLSVSSHFIHPDDVLDPERSAGRSWELLRSGYLKGLVEVRKRFPFLREMSVLQASEELARLLNTGWKVTREPEGRLRVVRSSGTASPGTLLVNLPEGCTADLTTGGSLLYSDPVSGRHHVRMEGRVLEIGCGDPSAGDRVPSVAQGAVAPGEAR